MTATDDALRRSCSLHTRSEIDGREQPGRASAAALTKSKNTTVAWRTAERGLHLTAVNSRRQQPEKTLDGKDTTTLYFISTPRTGADCAVPYLVDTPDLTPPPRDVGIGVQRLDEVVLGALDADDGDVYLGKHRPGVDVRERPLAQLQPPFDGDRVVHGGVDVERQRRRHLELTTRDRGGL